MCLAILQSVSGTHTMRFAMQEATFKRATANRVALIFAHAKFPHTGQWRRKICNTQHREKRWFGVVVSRQAYTSFHSKRIAE